MPGFLDLIPLVREHVSGSASMQNRPLSLQLINGANGIRAPPPGLMRQKNRGTGIGLCKELLFSPYCLFIVRIPNRWCDRHVLKLLRGNAMSFLSPLQWIVILAVVLLLFGGRGKISAIMGDFGKGPTQF